MRYWGKLAGIIIALFSGAGLWGVVVGLLLGHSVDRVCRRKQGYSRNRWHDDRQSFSEEKCQKLLLLTTFEVMGHISKSKGRVTQADIDSASNIMIRMGLNDRARQMAQDAFRAGKALRYPLRNKVNLLRTVCFGHFDVIRLFLQIQIEAAFANGILHPQQQHLLQIISDDLGVSRCQLTRYMQNRPWFNFKHDTHRQSHYRHSHHQYSHQHHYHHSSAHDSSNNLRAACTVLGVDPGLDAISIKRAYRKLMSQHHPDKLASRGLPPAMIQLAKQRAQQIQRAYDVIKVAKGFK